MNGVVCWSSCCAPGFTVRVLLLDCFPTIRPLERKPAPMPKSTWPTLDVFIPSTTSLSVVRYTVWAAMNLDYPRRLSCTSG